MRTFPLLLAGLLVTAACSGTTAAGDGSVEPDVKTEPAVVTMPPVPEYDSVALVDDQGRLAVVDPATNGVVSDWRGWTSLVSLDESFMVSVLDPTPAIPADGTQVVWQTIPAGEQIGAWHLDGTHVEPTAMLLGGHFTGFASPATPVEGAIAGARETSTIVLASPTDGEVYRTELDGNFMVEAIGRTLRSDGVPSQLFLLEYFPADAPRFYRVRVLSTETGEVSLPLNLRDKTQSVDERMAGHTRSQVVSADNGLLFTLYRGTIDGTPDGAPYAFVHTLDFADGVWCLEVDPTLELDEHPGSLAVAGDRLYVASGNGYVGSFRISSITNPSESPQMEWVVWANPETDEAPVMVAGVDKGVVVSFGDAQTVFIRADGEVTDGPLLPDAGATALTVDGDGTLHGVGDGWSTIPGLTPPDWLGEITRLVT